MADLVSDIFSALLEDHNYSGTLWPHMPKMFQTILDETLFFHDMIDVDAEMNVSARCWFEGLPGEDGEEKYWMLGKMDFATVVKMMADEVGEEKLRAVFEQGLSAWKSLPCNQVRCSTADKGNEAD